MTSKIRYLADRDVYYHSNNYDAHCKEYYIGNTQTEMIGLGYGIARGVGSNSPEQNNNKFCNRPIDHACIPSNTQFQSNHFEPFFDTCPSLA